MDEDMVKQCQGFGIIYSKGARECVACEVLYPEVAKNCQRLSAVAGKVVGYKGKSVKMQVYELWCKGETVESLIQTFQSFVKPGTVKNWISSWKKGDGIPRR